MALAILCTLACRAPASPVVPVTPPVSPAASASEHVSWSQLHEALASQICIAELEIDGQQLHEPMFGQREVCKLPPAASPLDHAVDATWRSARPVLDALRGTWAPRVLAVMQDAEQTRKLEAIRRIYLDDAALQRRLIRHALRELAAQNLRCDDCPRPAPPPRRDVDWAEFAPYLAAYAWPDPVATPRDAAGAPTGSPAYGMHVCVGLNGIAELPEADAELVGLGFLTSVHNPTFIEEARRYFEELTADPTLARLDDDAARTKWLRAQLGPRVVADTAVRRSVCEVAAGFVEDTGITIRECARWR